MNKSGEKILRNLYDDPKHNKTSGFYYYISRESTQQVVILAGKQSSISVRQLAAMERVWILFILFVCFTKLKRNSTCSVNSTVTSSSTFT
jgi:hypothetical protein